MKVGQRLICLHDPASIQIHNYFAPACREDRRPGAVVSERAEGKRDWVRLGTGTQAGQGRAVLGTRGTLYSGLRSGPRVLRCAAGFLQRGSVGDIVHRVVLRRQDSGGLEKSHKALRETSH